MSEQQVTMMTKLFVGWCDKNKLNTLNLAQQMFDTLNIYVCVRYRDVKILFNQDCV